MLVGTLILFLFTLAALYWFRYTCLLILKTNTAREYAKTVAEANGLSFLDATRKVQSDSREALDAMQAALHHDYQLLCCLLRHSTGFGVTRNRLQHLVLRADYALLRTVYPVVRVGSVQLTREALLEMARVVSYLAHCMGERSAALLRA